MNLWKKISNKRNVGARSKWEEKYQQWGVGLGVGILFLAIGFSKDQFADIYHKAVVICLECIGIG